MQSTLGWGGGRFGNGHFSVGEVSTIVVTVSGK